MSENIAVIDFSAYSVTRDKPDPEGFQQLVDDVQRVLSSAGCMYVKNHGFSMAKAERLMHVSRQFFSLPMDTKRQYDKVPEDMTGYVAPGDEGVPNRDTKEAFTFSFFSPHQSCPDKEVPEFRAAISDFWTGLIPLHNRILEVIARGLKLEIRTKNGKWIPVNPIEGTVFVIVSELMQRWTTDRYKAVLHRVVMTTDHLRKARQSIVFWGYPDHDATVECVDGSEKYPPINAKDYFKQRVVEVTESIKKSKENSSK